MALAALIAAYHESGEPGALRAILPLAGRTLVERQVRLAAAAGAAPVVLLVERMPAELVAAVERLRRDRLPVVVARSAEEAGDAIDAFDRVLIVADGAIADPSQFQRLAAAEGQAVLTVPDGAFDERFERIDAATRWGGFAICDGALLRDTAAMLRDWDMQSTLLRRVLQARARLIGAEGAIGILDGLGDLAELERRILAASERSGGGWAARLLAPAERTITAFLMGGGVSPAMIGLFAAGLAGAGALAIAYRYLLTGLVLLLLSTPLEGVAERLAKLRMQDGIARSWWSLVLPLFAGGALIALAMQRVEAQGWGVLLLAIVIILFLIALGIERSGHTVRGEALLAEPKGLAWLMLPFALAGLWEAGMATLFAYAAASFFWVQHRAHRAAGPAQD